ncbi:MAG: hypothetical protein OXC05_10010 [Halieaceae bacterium]|nr:hypothetical protein [Halieaceae bacterium]
MKGTYLTGLEGTNPLGFLAALGVQVAFAKKSEPLRLWWSDDITPRAIVDEKFTVERIAEQTLKVLGRWKESIAVKPQRPDGSAMPKGDELKLMPEDIKSYLEHATQDGLGGDLATALVAEGSLDNQGVAKPSDLYFTAGQQKFLGTVRKIMGAVVHEDLVTDMTGPWCYASELPSLGWDIADDRVYALRAKNPSPEKKRTNPGAEALAILGLSLHPVYAGNGRTLTNGCSGTWKSGRYTWPLWCKPASPGTVKSLLAHASHQNPPRDSHQRHLWYRSWGVTTVFQSSIRRSNQGGYGTFGPPEIVWQAR